ncbi:MAG: dihydrodipicolinate synthase family protein [Geminicoccaceae bacterium]
MAATSWRGVYPAVTTLFKADESIDHDATAKHIDWLIQEGVHGLIMLGTVGENCSLEAHEKLEVLKLAKEVSNGRVPVLSGVAEYTSRLAARHAEGCARVGIDGLMVLPAMVYKTEGDETLAHFRTVARATDLPIMVYNNPIAYGVDISPEMFADLADEKTLVAIKESSDDVRRVTDLVNRTGDRYVLFCGVDDIILESAMLGVVGWVSGLVNAFPRESVWLWDKAVAGQYAEALPLYRWYADLLHLDTKPKLVQYIKLVQAMVGRGSELCRAPRGPVTGAERAMVEKIVKDALANRPKLG